MMIKKVLMDIILKDWEKRRKKEGVLRKTSFRTVHALVSLLKLPKAWYPLIV
jgi:hypothetical protein